MRAIVAIASTGYCPTAVSCDSITASVPSRIALATSVTSARVGRGEPTIESSIWVAVIEGRANRPASAITRFCTIGTSDSGSSTPRSPRATITQSAARTMSSARSTACGFSIFAISGRRVRSRTCSTSLGRRTNDSATMSTPIDSPNVNRSRSSSGTLGRPASSPGTFTPWREATVPGDSTTPTNEPSVFESTRSRTAPSARKISSPSVTASGRPAQEIVMRSALPSSSLPQTNVTRSPCARSAMPSRSGPIRILGPGRSCSTATWRPTLPAALRMRSIVSACSRRVPCEKLSRATSIPASIIRTSVSGSREAGPMVATIFVRRNLRLTLLAARTERALDDRARAIVHPHDGADRLRPLPVDPHRARERRAPVAALPAVAELEVGPLDESPLGPDHGDAHARLAQPLDPQLQLRLRAVHPVVHLHVGGREALRRRARVAHGHQAAERSHVGGPVGADRHRRVVVVEAEPLAGQPPEHRLARAEVDRGQVPAVAAVRLVRRVRVDVDQAVAKRQLRHHRRRGLARVPDGLAALAVGVEVDALDAGLGRGLALHGVRAGI